jgi:hypothetical protein
MLPYWNWYGFAPAFLDMEALDLVPRFFLGALILGGLMKKLLRQPQQRGRWKVRLQAARGRESIAALGMRRVVCSDEVEVLQAVWSKQPVIATG